MAVETRTSVPSGPSTPVVPTASTASTASVASSKTRHNARGVRVGAWPFLWRCRACEQFAYPSVRLLPGTVAWLCGGCYLRLSEIRTRSLTTWQRQTVVRSALGHYERSDGTPMGL